MFGIFSKTTDSNLIEAIGLAGLDFIIVDDEHGLTNFETQQNHARALKSSKTLSILRVSHGSASNIAKALDIDYDGVQVPNINSFIQAKEVVEAARFFPKGKRGVCRYVPSALYGQQDKFEYLKESNNKLLILQIEGEGGIRDLDEILTLDFDVLFIGPYDLSQSLGHPGQVDHPVVLRAIDGIVLKVKECGKRLGTFVDSPELGNNYRKKGFDYIACSVDISLFLKSIITLKNKYDE